MSLQENLLTTLVHDFQEFSGSMGALKEQARDSKEAAQEMRDAHRKLKERVAALEKGRRLSPKDITLIVTAFITAASGVAISLIQNWKTLSGK